MTLFTMQRYVMISSTSSLCYVYNPIALFVIIFAFEDINTKFLFNNLLITLNYNTAFISIHVYIFNIILVHVH